ncbi:hypothetical protein BpHYR1_043466 [Brachionus plicatilis]|uniref:Uncharacterized protein n=1 Tax=Brachionus plicatilis TaxID=10195 RepID=A0A3M7T6V5_BRAPC|nr:hypothetical protein BpHYR1_043466 [Brachionus plicatilis]
MISDFKKSNLKSEFYLNKTNSIKNLNISIKSNLYFNSCPIEKFKEVQKSFFGLSYFIHNIGTHSLDSKSLLIIFLNIINLLQENEMGCLRSILQMIKFKANCNLTIIFQNQKLIINLTKGLPGYVNIWSHNISFSKSFFFNGEHFVHLSREQFLFTYYVTKCSHNRLPKEIIFTHRNS